MEFRGIAATLCPWTWLCPRSLGLPYRGHHEAGVAVPGVLEHHLPQSDCRAGDLQSQHWPPDSGNLAGVVYLGSQSPGKHLFHTRPGEGNSSGPPVMPQLGPAPSWLLPTGPRVASGLRDFCVHFLSHLSHHSAREGCAVPRPQGETAPQRRGSKSS